MNPNLYQSIKYFEQALNVYTPDLFPQQASETYINLGYAYLQSGQFNEANNAFVKSSQIYTNLSACRKWADIQLKIGFALHQTSNIDCLRAAISYFSASTHIFQLLKLSDGYLISLLNLGLTYKKIGFFDLAFQTLEKVVQTIDFDKKTLESMQEATQVFIEKTSRKPSNLQSFKSDTNGLINELISEETTIDTVDFLQVDMGLKSARSPNLRESTHQLYQSIVEICLNLGNWEKAIEYTDRSKARNLVELMATRDAYPGGVIPDNDRQQLHQLKIDIAQAERRIQDGENPDPTHLKQLRQQKQELEPYKPLHFQGMQELLDKETAILEWYILGDKFLTFTLMPDPPLTSHSEGGEQEADPSEPPFLRGAGGIKIWQSSKEDLDKLIDWTTQYLSDYYSNKTQWHDNLSQRLETLAKILHLPEILQNLSKQFPNCKKLILIPHRYLHLFPLHALPIPTGESEVKSLQELFEKGVTYAPNCQLLQQAQTRYRPNFKRLFAVQNPTDNLSFADLEVETIRRLFPDRSTLQKHNATKANFLAKDLRQTHHLFFSCHAGFNRNSPLDSGLQLADGILTLEEIIASLNLSQCSLVTLSACETGQVALDTTDEYISLSSGFILAGSPSVLVSLWSVNQVSTALLLIKTYEILHKHPGQLAIALKTAQIWLRDTTIAGFQDWVQECPLLKVVEYWQKYLAKFFQKLGQNEKGVNHRPYQSPYHWAAFCVVGQGEQKMASDSDKIQAFTHLLSNDLLADYLPDLEELNPQVGDDDEKNAEAIEQWLNTDQRKSILTAYQEQLKSITSINPLLGVTGEKGIGGSKPNHKTPNLSLKELIENTTKDNTNLHKNPEEKPPQS